MALTSKKRLFIDALRKGASNKDAAIAAGYSEKSASAAGSRMAKDPDVVAELHKLNALHPVKGDVKKTVKDKRPETAVEPADEASAEPEDEDFTAAFDLNKALHYSDPKAYLLAAMNDPETDPKLRIDAAKALMPFVHQRKGETGKKEAKVDAAKTAATGRYGTGKPPLKVVK
ncbi:terminase small subunit [Pseudomonas sp. GD03842]|uniref:terminase small subunit n=1 Tax=Pseudomonas sp. GD03842 TaxID=2975385 RepID=UPI00244B2251|nr:terminase small subunit [Pseudomonas sp. GD03842]MDH0745742.1 terminase small subunit [Pseudomonas sp. GD03842]